MLQMKVTQAGRLKINDLVTKVMNIQQKLSISHINNVLSSLIDELIYDIENFFLEREYLNTGHSYHPLSDSWSKRKSGMFKDHFHVDTLAMLGSLMGKVSGGRLKISVGSDQQDKFEKIESLRPIAHDHGEYFVQKVYNKLLERLRNDINNA